MNLLLHQQLRPPERSSPWLCLLCINTFAQHTKRKGIHFWPHQCVRVCVCMCCGGILGSIVFHSVACISVTVCFYFSFFGMYAFRLPPIHLKQTESGSCGEGELSWQQLEKRMIKNIHGNIEMIIATPYLFAIQFFE